MDGLTRLAGRKKRGRSIRKMQRSRADEMIDEGRKRIAEGERREEERES